MAALGTALILVADGGDVAFAIVSCGSAIIALALAPVHLVVANRVATALVLRPSSGTSAP